MRALLACAVAALACSSCLYGNNNSPVNQGPLSLEVGQSADYSLYTHCGVLYTTINGTTFYADPPQSDGNGNPPAGWRNPFDNGQVKLTSATTADFSDPDGHRAHFTSTPAGPTPTVLPCD